MRHLATALALAALGALAHAEEPFPLPVVPCELLEGGCAGNVAPSPPAAPVRNGDWAAPAIRTVSARGASPAGPPRAMRANLSRVQMELGPKALTVRPGTTVIVEIAIGHLNRIVTPFENPVVRTASTAPTEVDGSAIYVAPDSEDPVALFILDGQGSETALSLTLAPRYIPPREIRLQVPGYKRGRSGAAQTTVPDGLAGTNSAAETVLANASSYIPDAGHQPYVSGIVNLLRAMAQGSLPAGFTVTKGTGGAKVRCADGLRVRKTQLTQGPIASVVTLAIENRSGKTMQADQYACDLDNVVVAASGAWPHRALAPGQSTELFLVLAQGSRSADPTGRPR